MRQAKSAITVEVRHAGLTFGGGEALQARRDAVKTLLGAHKAIFLRRAFFHTLELVQEVAGLATGAILYLILTTFAALGTGQTS